MEVVTRNRTSGRAFALLLVASTIAWVGSVSVAVPAHAAGIGYHTVKGGLNDPAGFTFAPTGTIWFLEKNTGWVKRLNPSTGGIKAVYRIPGVDGSDERGALGIALHPGWPATPYVYVYVTRRPSGTAPVQNQLVRLKIGGGLVVGVKVLFHSPLSSATNHNGGRILFGPDGRLYLVIGENADPANSQDLTKNVRGKILRVNGNGTPAAGNPFGNRIWAFGIRNSFGFAFDPANGRLWETENGPSCNDELNLIVEGGNYAWGSNESCGSSTPPTDTNNSGPAPRRLPKYYFGSTLGLTGGVFCQSCGLGAGYEGQFFFGDVNDGELRRVPLNAARDDVLGTPVNVLAEPGGAIYSMETAPNGHIYFSNYQGIFRLVPA